MTMDEIMKRDGLKFIVGTWQPDYVVNAFSNDLAHIPAAEFKSEDGRDLTALKFVFKEDNTVELSDDATGRKETGTWEQTSLVEYHYTFESFFEIPDSTFKKNAETLMVIEGDLAFSLGLLTIALKKTEEGTVTEEPDIGEKEQSASDLAMDDIVGKYCVAKSFAFIGDGMGLHTPEEIEANIQAQLASGEMDEHDAQEERMMFRSVIEITADHRILSWSPLPEGVSDEEIKEAIEAGAIKEVRDGMFLTDVKEWKAVDGKYYINTEEEREVFGEKQSSWDELTTDEEGYLNFSQGMLKLKKM